MKVYTKKGDKGTTQLVGGNRVSKGSLRIESYGTIDELNSYIGFVRDQKAASGKHDQLVEIQDRLFTLGSQLAMDASGTKMKLPDLFESDVENLEKWIDEMEETLEPMTSFVLPGGHTYVSITHVARCVCRRAERLVVNLSTEDVVPNLAIPYLNRLSDYLFVLSRWLTKETGAIEHPWKPRL